VDDATKVPRRLVIIDAANCLYRAFFGLPPLRAADGFPTNAIFGFAKMLAKVIREEKPDAVAVVFDPPGGCFRDQIYPDYKANRDAQPEDLSAQFPVARELVEAYRIPVLEVAGFEADDVIATLVKNAPAATEVAIVSTDKDLMQLVGERVSLLDTVKGTRIGPAEVEERFGVPPELLLDARALAGDASDNIPGVRGIGEKGAARLISEWGDLETLLESAEKVTAKKAREALIQQAEEARLSKRLATLCVDVPLECRFESLSLRGQDDEALRALYRRLGFTQLLESLGSEEGGADQPADRIAVETVTCLADLESLVAQLAELDGIAVLMIGDEKKGGLVDEPAGFCFALAGDRAAYLPIGAPTLLQRDCIPLDEAMPLLRTLLGSPLSPPWLSRDTKQLQTLLGESGVRAKLPGFDLELAAHLLDPAGPRTTQALASQHLGRTLRTWEEVAGRGAKATSAQQLAPEVVAAWGAEEVCALCELAPRLAGRLKDDALEPLFEDVELPLTAVLSGMERAGVRVDEAVLAELSDEYQSELSGIEGRIFALAGESFQVGSPKQLQRILFEKLKLPVIRKTKTGYSTDEGVLEQLSAHHELPGEVLAYRKLAKLKSTYVDALPPLVDPTTGRIHPTFHQSGAATGRLSSSHPNVQNIPIRSEEGIRIREAFVSAEGHRLLSADYSQVELRILAHFSRDESLIEAFRSGEDIHQRTAAEVSGIAPEQVTAVQRAHAKAINFGIIYGSSAFGIANQLGIAQADAQSTIDAYFAQYRGVRRFLDATVEAAKRDGFVRTLLGRRRYLPDLTSRNRVLRQAAERMAVNTVIQGTAADLIKKAMVEVVQVLEEQGLSARMILQVHDELVFEVSEAEAGQLESLVRDRMESVYALEVPLVVDVGLGSNWREAH
jgi:DNA polymerase-1